MKSKKVDCVVVGADRIAANGDTANKIGTYMVAVLAKQNNIPFYVAAPVSTLDLSLFTGEQIPIEERAAREVTHIGTHQMGPDGVQVHNPAFDITPNDLITAIITDKGVARSPYTESLRALVNEKALGLNG
jgi:methylthioribose-1-phosphate isomerase